MEWDIHTKKGEKKNADIALRRAKGLGGNRLCCYGNQAA
jgi:hypothetical protein